MLAFSRQRFHAKKSGVFTLEFSRQGLKKRQHEIFYEMDPVEAGDIFYQALC